MSRPEYRVVVYHSNGRLLRGATRYSKYAAKHLFKVWCLKYDDSYVVKLIPPSGEDSSKDD